MKIFPPQLNIGERDGFTPENDLFKRKELGLGLTNLVTSVTDPMVIAIDAQWGSGKTVFLKMWAGELRKLGVPVVYFDAFANDHHDDAFLALAAEIIELAQSKQATEKPLSDFTAKAANAGKVLLSSATRLAGKALVRAVTVGTLSAADVSEEISSSVGDHAADLTEKQLTTLLESTRERKITLDAFRTALSELPALLAEQVSSENQTSVVPPKHKPLVFIIDELDRCSPHFALSLLERIKHFFSVSNVQFVFGVHLDQLANSVKATYGSDIDAQAYLQKFIHVPVPLLDTPRYPGDAAAVKYIEYLSRSLQLQDVNSRLVELITEFLAKQATYQRLSLRTIERIYTTIAIAMATLPPNRLAIGPLIAGLAILKITKPDLYRAAKQRKLRYQNVESLFGFDVPPEDAHEKHAYDWTVGFWRYATDPDAPQEIKQQYSQGMAQYHLSPLDLLPHLANNVIDKFTPR